MLVQQGSDGQGLEFYLGDGSLIGRDPQARVCLPHPTVSWHHA